MSEQNKLSVPLISIVTPTWNREAFLPAIFDCVRNQTYPNIEWLVHDDSSQPSAALSNAKWPGLRYFHSTERLSIGEKRNFLVNEAKGDIIVNFDDDDFYGPTYVSNRVDALLQSDAMLSITSGFFAYHLTTGHFGYYRPNLKSGPAYQFNRNGVRAVDLEKLNIPWIQLCYGWAFVYRKELWNKIKFPDISIFEDRSFVIQAMNIKDVHSYSSKKIDAIHAIHGFSSSSCFPQFIIPPFMMDAESSAPRQHIDRLRGVIQALKRDQS